MYGITYNLNVETLDKNFNGTLEDAKKTICDFFNSNYFTVYNDFLFLSQSQTAVDCVLVMQKLNRSITWFKYVVKDIRLIHIRDIDNLLITVLPNSK